MIHADVAVVLPKACTNEKGGGGVVVTRTSFGITHTILPYVFRDAHVSEWGKGMAVGASEVKMG